MQDPVEALPYEVVCSVFSLLPPHELAVTRTVSRAWKACADDNGLWRSLCRSLYRDSLMGDPDIAGISRIVCSARLQHQYQAALWQNYRNVFIQYYFAEKLIGPIAVTPLDKTALMRRLPGNDVILYLPFLDKPLEVSCDVKLDIFYRKLHAAIALTRERERAEAEANGEDLASRMGNNGADNNNNEGGEGEGEDGDGGAGAAAPAAARPDDAEMAEWVWFIADENGEVVEEGTHRVVYCFTKGSRLVNTITDEQYLLCEVGVPNVSPQGWQNVWDVPVSDAEVIRGEDGELKSATVNWLLMQFVSAESPDPLMLHEFFMVFPSFIHAECLLVKFMQVYHMPVPDNEDGSPLTAEQIAAGEETVVQAHKTRVANIILYWVTQRGAAFEAKPLLCDALRAFARHTMAADGLESQATNIIAALRTHDLRGPWAHIAGDELGSADECVWPTTAELNSGSDAFGVYIFSKYPARHIAEQITLLDFASVAAVPTYELLNRRWNIVNPFRLTEAANVVRVLSRFNSLANWIPMCILATDNKKLRVKILTIGIELLDHFLELNNYLGFIRTYVGLNMTTIHRLKPLWAKLPSSVLEKYESRKSLATLSNDRAALRALMQEGRLPCVCALTLLLRDATFIEDGNTTEILGSIERAKEKFLGGATPRGGAGEGDEFDSDAAAAGPAEPAGPPEINDDLEAVAAELEAEMTRNARAVDDMVTRPAYIIWTKVGLMTQNLDVLLRSQSFPYELDVDDEFMADFDAIRIRYDDKITYERSLQILPRGSR